MTESKKLQSGSTICAGAVHTAMLPLTIDQYYIGMPLSYNTTTTKYAYQSNISNADAIYYAGERNITVAVDGQAIVGGVIYETGLVSDSGTKLTITEANRKALRAKGFYPVP